MSSIRFEDITDTAGIALIPGLTFGAAWGNFNEDTFPDLFVSNHFNSASLYLNQGDGTFIDISSEVFLPEDLEGDTHGAAWADFDNDGDQDIIQLVGAKRGTGSDPNRLYVNQGGQFENQASTLGIDYPLLRGRTPLWLDFDNDGWLDIVMGGAERDDAPPTIFRQTNDGFEDVRSTTGFAPSHSRFSVLSDLSGDGKLDLVGVGRFQGSSSRVTVYDITSIPFKDITTTRIRPNSDNDIAIADFNNDLLPDVYLARNREDSVEGFVDDLLFINTGEELVEQSEEAGINDIPHPGRSVVAADFDNDMDVDVYIDATTAQNKPNILLENQGDGTFIAIPDAGGATGTNEGNGDSVLTADIDLDGFLDLFVVNQFAQDQLFRNQGNDNHWIQIDLEGVVSNRDGIGAQVFVTAGGVTQYREQSGGMHRSAQNHQRIHFGLGNNTQIDELVIKWPSGIEQRLENIPADQLIQVTEFSDTLVKGQPDYNPSEQEGLFLWQDPDDQQLWRLRATAGGENLSRYQGSITSDSPAELIQAVGLEPNDQLITNNPLQIDFDLRVRNVGEDGIDFRVPAGATLLLDLEGYGQETTSLVQLGSEQWSINSLPLDLSEWT